MSVWKEAKHQVMGWKQDLGDQIRDARKSLRLTQKELAHSLRISRQMVSRYEKGRDVPSVEYLARMSEILESEFEVKGFRVSFEQTEERPALRVVPKQLQLEFEKSRRFRGAMVEITPRKGRILIRADIPA
jgi:transcriptional regulator with XRE-family HTH domain